MEAGGRGNLVRGARQPEQKEEVGQAHSRLHIHRRQHRLGAFVF